MNNEDLKEQQLISVEKKKEIKTEKVINRNKIGRNQKCICGSGKKYKKCCLKKEQQVKNNLI